MAEETDSGLSEMTLPEIANYTRPLSSLVLQVLNWADSSSAYFEEGLKSGDGPEVNRQKVRKYFHAAFYYRSRYYLPFFVLILSLAIIDSHSRMTPFHIPLQVYGLVLDAVGALIIALGLFRGIDGIQRDAPRQSTGAVYGGNIHYNPKPLSSTVRDTVDGVYGSAFLFTGFILQIFSLL